MKETNRGTLMIFCDQALRKIPIFHNFQNFVSGIHIPWSQLQIPFQHLFKQFQTNKLSFQTVSDHLAQQQVTNTVEISFEAANELDIILYFMIQNVQFWSKGGATLRIQEKLLSEILYLENSI